jgi:hypothetical protein
MRDAQKARERKLTVGAQFKVCLRMCTHLHNKLYIIVFFYRIRCKCLWNECCSRNPSSSAALNQAENESLESLMINTLPNRCHFFSAIGLNHSNLMTHDRTFI